MPSNSNSRPNIPQAQILREGRRLYGHYAEHEGDFNSYRAVKFTAEFKAALQKDISDMENTPSDAALKAAQATETAAFTAIKKEYRELHAELDGVLNDLPANRDAILSEFGFGRATDILLNASTLHRFLLDLPQVFAKYAADLTKIGIPATVESGFAALEQKLAAHITSCASAHDTRHSSTLSRGDTANDLYTKLVAIDDAAETIYKGNPSVRNLFVFDKTRTPTRHPDNTPPTEPPKPAAS